MTDPVPVRIAFALARELCSIFSSGGDLTHKVDFWAGQRNFGTDRYTPVVAGGTLIVCQDLFEVYAAQRTDGPPAGLAVDADLARFYLVESIGTDQPIAGLSDREVRAEARAVCRRVSGTTLGRPVNGPGRTEQTRVLVLALVFCPDDVDLADP